MFTIDATDVEAVLNPCIGLAPGTLYVGDEASTDLASSRWMRRRYAAMGGQYQSWFSELRGPETLFNCGLIGGSRDTMIQLLDEMLAVFAKFDSTGYVPLFVGFTFDMPALNYILHTTWRGTISSGPPVNSHFGKYEAHRGDVWFRHKL